MATCFFFNRDSGIVALMMTAALSPITAVGLLTLTPRHLNMYQIAIISSDAVLIALNSALYVNVSIDPCLLLSPWTGVRPTKMIMPVIDLLV